MPKLKLFSLAIALTLVFIFGCGKKSVVSDFIPPTVQIAFPADSATLSGDTVFVTVTASDDKGVARVDFYVDGETLFTDFSSPFIFPWLILVYNDSTVHTLSAVAVDGAGNADTFTISVTVRVAPGFYFISATTTAATSYYNLFVWGNYAAVAQQGNGLQIYDISNPADPKFLSSYSTGGGSANGIFVSGNYLFIAYGQEGLHILDVSNPASPIYRSSLVLPGFADVENVFVAGNYAYLAAKNSGLYIVDLSNLDTLVALSQYNLGSGIAYDIKVIDTLAYIAYGDVGLEIVNLKNPLIPAFVGRYTPAGSALARRLDVVGNRAYLALQNAGLDIVSLAVPTAPVQLGNYNTFNSFFTGVQVDGNNAYLANRDDGVQIVDVSLPATPSSINFFNTEGQANNLVFRNSFIYVADQSSLTLLRYVP